jgi:hypothetical protein
MDLSELVPDDVMKSLEDHGFEVVYVGPTDLHHSHGPITVFMGFGGTPFGTLTREERTGNWTLTTTDQAGTTTPPTREHRKPAEPFFVVMCNSQPREPGASGVSDKGIWRGDVFDTREEAEAQVNSHEHPMDAFVVEF